MIRFLVLIGVLFAIITGFAYLKETPGDISLTIDKTNYSMDLAGAAAAILILVVVALIVIWLLRAILLAPTSAIRGWRGRRELKARRAMARGFLAIAAGDVENADLAAREATRSLPGAPLTLLLNAQTAQLKGDRDGARTFFNEMIERPETKVVGLRGLHIEAAREGEDEAARHYAEKAQEAGSSVPWASRALLRYQTAQGEWDMALATLALSDGKARDKKAIRRKRAIILTAKAMDLELRDPDNAKKAALEAHQLAPGLVPAAMVAGRLLSRQGEIRRASKVLETTWKQNPHPDIAYAFAHARAGDSARDRLKRTETLQKLRPQADEGRFAVARAAMEARDWTLARQILLPLLKTRPTQNALMIMAEIEESENGDSGRAREWLSRAVLAPRDKAWLSDGMILDDWAPASPITGELDTVEWKVPAERLSPAEDFKIGDLELNPPRAAIALNAGNPIIQKPIAIEEKADDIEVQSVETAIDGNEKNDAASILTSSEAAEKLSSGSTTDLKSKTQNAIDHAAPSGPGTETSATNDKAASEHEILNEMTGAIANTATDGASEQGAPSESKQNSSSEIPLAAKVDDVSKIEPQDASLEAEESQNTLETSDPVVDKETKGAVDPPLPDDPGVETEEEPEPKRFKLF